LFKPAKPILFRSKRSHRQRIKIVYSIKWLINPDGGKEMKRIFTFFLALVFAVSLVSVASAAKKGAPEPTPTPAPEKY
jgi:hypothetical protein